MGATRTQQAHRGHIRRFDAVFGGPIWWAVHFGGSYWLAPRTCVWGTTWPIHVLTLAMVLLIGRAFLSGLQLVRAGREAGALGADAGEGAGATGGYPRAARDVFVGWLGMALAAFFGAVTLAEWVPSLMIDPCA